MKNRTLGENLKNKSYDIFIVIAFFKFCKIWDISQSIIALNFYQLIEDYLVKIKNITNIQITFLDNCHLNIFRLQFCMCDN